MHDVCHIISKTNAPLLCRRTVLLDDYGHILPAARSLLITVCLRLRLRCFKDWRNDPLTPSSPPYGTSEVYWHVLTARILTSVIFVLAVVAVVLIAFRFLPEIPRKIEILHQREHFLAQEAIYRCKS